MTTRIRLHRDGKVYRVVQRYNLGPSGKARDAPIIVRPGDGDYAVLEPLGGGERFTVDLSKTPHDSVHNEAPEKPGALPPPAKPPKPSTRWVTVATFDYDPRTKQLRRVQ